MTMFVVIAIAVVRCTGPQEQEAGGASTSGGDAARTAREAKASRTDAGIPPMPAYGNYDCADFQTRAQAVAVLERDPSARTTSTATATAYPARTCPRELDAEEGVKVVWGIS